MATEGLTARRLTWTLPRWLRGPVRVGLVAGALLLLGIGLGRTRSLVWVDVDGLRIPVHTRAPTVADALRQTGLELLPEDLVSPELASALQPGTVVRIQRAQPVVLHADGQVHSLRTHATTVAQLLSDAGLQAGPGDELWLEGQLVGPDAPLDNSLSLAGQGTFRGGSRPLGDTSPSGPIALVLRRATALTLDDGGVKTILHSTAATVGQVLQQQGVTLFLADRVVPGLQDRVEPGMAVTIQRSVPVEIEVDGRRIRTRTVADTVAGILGQEGIALVGRDTVEPDLTAPTVPSMTIHVTRVDEVFATELEPIPFQAVWVADPDTEIDSRRLVQQGQTGLTKRRYRVRYENSQEVDRFLEDTWVDQPPITKTLAYGTKIVVRTLETPDGPIEYWRKMRVYTTSYTAASCGKSPDHPRYGYTRLGWKLRKGIVAVDPTVIPLKTKLYVPGYGLAVAGDTGGGVKGKFVDLGFDSWNYQSWHWWTDIYILTPAPRSSEIRWVLPDWPRYPDRKRR